MVVTDTKEYETWNWDSRDIDLAREHNLSRERIRQIRKSLGKPKCQFARRGSVFITIAKEKDRFKNKTVGEIAADLGASYYTVWQHLKTLGIEPIRGTDRFRKHPWHLMNFDLPNVDLETIWSVSKMCIANYRHKNKLPSAKYCVAGGYAPTNSEEYMKDIEAEKAKVIQWKNSEN